MSRPLQRGLVFLMFAMSWDRAWSRDLQARPRTWAEEKCLRYDRTWKELLDFVGRDGVSREFIEGNQAFIAAGCSNGADVCPTTARDFELANALTKAAMNFGTASSFLPFICREW